MDNSLTGGFPIERDPYAAPDQHITFSSGVSLAERDGAEFREVRKKNIRKAQTSKHCRVSRTS